jgi:hypothetical protein
MCGHFFGKVWRALSVVLLVVGVVTMVNTSAHAAPDIEQGDSVNNHCVTRVKRVAPGSPHTEVVRRACAPSAEQARAELAGVRSAAIPVPLVTVFEHADWGGLEDTIEGDEDCDSAGYYIPTFFVNAGVNGISSYGVWFYCNGSQTFYRANDTTPCSEGTGDVRWVGQACNYHIYAMRVFRRY